MKRNKQKQPATGKSVLLPDLKTVLPELSRRQLRAGVALLVRGTLVGILSALIARQAPGLRPIRPLLDVVGVLLVLWPYLTAMGRIYAWRIRVGRAFVDASQWPEAVRVLSPLSGIRGRLFDATGEGRFYLACALLATKQTEQASHLYTQLAQEARPPFRELAARAARETASDTQTQAAPVVEKLLKDVPAKGQRVQ